MENAKPVVQNNKWARKTSDDAIKNAKPVVQKNNKQGKKTTR
jgi:hypothetical protein